MSFVTGNRLARLDVPRRSLNAVDTTIVVRVRIAPLVYKMHALCSRQAYPETRKVDQIKTIRGRRATAFSSRATLFRFRLEPPALASLAYTNSCPLWPAPLVEANQPREQTSLSLVEIVIDVHRSNVATSPTGGGRRSAWRGATVNSVR